MALGLVGILSLMWSCGYHAVGRSALPGDVHTIDIQMLVNRSIETGAEVILTNALADELNRRRPGTIARAGHSDAVLSGTIESINRKTVSRSGELTALTERITVTISLYLKDRSGHSLWKRIQMKTAKDYSVVDGDVVATEDNRRRAIKAAALRLAEDAFRGLTDNF